MSAGGRATEFMRAWGEGHNKPHNPGCKEWGADDCDACVAEAFEPWEALVHAAWIMGWPPEHPAPFSIEAVVRARVGTRRAVLTVAADLPAQVPVVLDAGTRVRLAVLPAQDGDPAGSDTGVADSDRGSSSGTNLRPGGEPSPSRQGRAIV